MANLPTQVSEAVDEARVWAQRTQRTQRPNERDPANSAPGDAHARRDWSRHLATLKPRWARRSPAPGDLCHDETHQGHDYAAVAQLRPGSEERKSVIFCGVCWPQRAQGDGDLAAGWHREEA